MDFIGEDGDAAPRLKDVDGLGPEDWAEIYASCVQTMRVMLQTCRLVHGDLSEYNMLYDDGKLVIIDVSQSMECDHPQALDFLKRDCVNINNFFGKRMQRAPIPVRRLFDFITTKDLSTVVEGRSFGVNDSEKALQALL